MLALAVFFEKLFISIVFVSALSSRMSDSRDEGRPLQESPTCLCKSLLFSNLFIVFLSIMIVDQTNELHFHREQSLNDLPY